MREVSNQALLHLVNTQHIAVGEFPLARCRVCGAAKVGERAVHIPFYIFHICGGKYILYSVINIVAHLLAGDIKHKLVAAAARCAVFNLYCPVRMCPVQVGIRGDHLRLKPDAEFHAERIYAIHQCL